MVPLGCHYACFSCSLARLPLENDRIRERHAQGIIYLEHELSCSPSNQVLIRHLRCLAWGISYKRREPKDGKWDGKSTGIDGVPEHNTQRRESRWENLVFWGYSLRTCVEWTYHGSWNALNTNIWTMLNWTRLIVFVPTKGQGCGCGWANMVVLSYCTENTQEK